MVDVGPEGTAYNGDHVVILGRYRDQEIPIEEAAAWTKTIPYEVLTNLNTRIPRVHVEDADRYDLDALVEVGSRDPLN
ncbi:MAG: hypothetical protein HC923_06825 [Myxococcales bacterium]|nr:hypothetical protein [Myxococcales bacterium]